MTQRKKSERNNVPKRDANAKPTIGVAMALKHGHANGEVEEGLKAVEEANNEYVHFLEGVALDRIKK